MNLFDQLEQVSKLPHGWCSLEKAKTLAGIILATRPKVVVEIGVWSGKSLIPMALACKEVGVGKVIGIDPWSASASAEGQDGKHKEWWSKVNHEEMYQYFLRQRKAFGVEEWSEVIRSTSDAATPPEGIGLLSLDGNHGIQAVKDAQRYGQRVNVGGFAVLDDLGWQGGAVSQSVDTLITFGFELVFRVEKPGQDWGVFRRTKCWQQIYD